MKDKINKPSSIEDFEEYDCQAWDDGELKEHAMINIMIAKIRELINEVNTLKQQVQKS